MSNPPNQKAQDKAEGQAAATPSPGESRDVFVPAPDIEVGPFKVRRFVDGDFVALSGIGHPLNHIAAIADGSYKFVPTGKDCWILCWIMTRPRSVSKEKIKTSGIAGIEEEASDEFGDLPIFALNKLMVAILKQINIYIEAHLEYEPNKKGEQSSSTPSSPRRDGLRKKDISGSQSNSSGAES
jgi:hypothetical protein